MPIEFLPEPAHERLHTLRAAADALPAAYVPYSNYPVAVVVESVDGRLYAGMNFENSAFTPTQHAEETAITAALLDGVRERCGDGWLQTVYVRCASEGAPCGHCRQVIAEWIAPGAEWIGDDTRDGTVLRAAFSELLPLGFGSQYLR